MNKDRRQVKTQNVAYLIGVVFTEIAHNRLFGVVFLSWFIAQSIKITTNIIKRKQRFNFKWFANPGGMPSAHSATVGALATGIGINWGFDSDIFAFVLLFSLITIFNAAVFRRNVGKQAEILNRLIEDIYAKRGLRKEKLKELLGHTPLEVIAGLGLGIAVALLFMGI
ncbi:MAG: divergent PAP2 family protein [Candidatus Omnitrophota bacterium]|nr:MAG: divergent PAP2 family protein [Candidatus Omnitrophota bacterium]